MPTTLSHIIGLTFDLIDCTLSVQLTDNPDAGGVATLVTFTSVGNVRVDRYHEPETERHSYGEFERFRIVSLPDRRSRYTTNTGDAVISFEADAAAEISSTRGDAPPWSAVFVAGGPVSA